MGSTGSPEIDLNAINSEVAGLSKEALEAEVLKFRVRQKKQQKRQQGSGAQKGYQQKQRAKFNAMKAEAIRLGIWDKINEQAEQQAEAELTNEADVAEEVA
jgi:hypothetical protein